MSNKSGKTFTGYQRRRETRLSVRLGDLTARSLITVGGIGTIIAVSAVCLFLVSVAVPLFRSGEVEQQPEYAVPWQAEHAQPLHIAVDDHQTIGWALSQSGRLHVFRLGTGELIEQRDLLEDGQRLTAASFGDRRGDVIFGFEDGSIQRGTIAFETSYVEPEDLPADIRQRRAGELAVHEDGVVSRTPTNQFRMRRVKVEFDDPTPLENPSPIIRLSHTQYAGRTMLTSYTQDGRLLLSEVRERRNLLTGEVRVQLDDRELPFTLPAGRGAPDYVAMAGLGDNIFVIWNDGHLLRYDLRDRANPRVVEVIDLVAEEGEAITAVNFMLGRHSLVTGDSLGRVRVWFRVPAEVAAQAEARGDAEVPVRGNGSDAADAVAGIESDGVRLVNAHQLPGPAGGVPVTALARSLSSRMLSAGYADGTVRLFQVTANNLVLETQTHAAGGVAMLLMTPRDDGMVALTQAGVHAWRVDRKHPAVTLKSILTPVWYEDYATPQHIWQSSSGQDDFEPKYGLVPLIFGTLKATFYSMLFGLPLAVLAAIYTSEFLHRKLRARIKPVIEMMASLPSVVLGFVAALVIAPVVEQAVPAALVVFFIVPTAVLLGGFLWQLLPYAWYVRLTNWRFLFITAAVLAALPVAVLGGPVAERLLFAGDIRAWLSGDVGSGVAGWFVLMLPISAIGVAVLFSRYVNPALRQRFGQRGRRPLAVADLVKYLAGLALTLAIAGVLGMLMTYGLGWDPRGGEGTIWGMDLAPLKTYEQRNALIVGFVMGFAIIPIIYTISEDALTAVPAHLRSASLGAGATPWQTAVRLIVPTAMSGLFSAAMIGLGRAAGETMIVLMAAGNTPVMEMNIFNGFRTLSANIAVELPEAAVGGTHFRMLFLAALTLFVITFAINTFAEAVRLRFRKRAYQL